MTIEQAYLQYLQTINRNATNNNTSVSKDRFVLTFNNIQNRYVEWVLEKRNEDDIRDIQLLLQKDVPLTLLTTDTKFQSYQLPNNYFDFANLRADAKADCCPADNIHLFEVKSEDVESLFVDTNNEPSFSWRESFYHFGNNSVILYRKNFEYDKVFLTYYRYPRQVDIQGYFVGNVASTNIDPEFDDKVINRIILGVAKEFAAMTSDTASYQMDKDRLFTF